MEISELLLKRLNSVLARYEEKNGVVAEGEVVTYNYGPLCAYADCVNTCSGRGLQHKGCRGTCNNTCIGGTDSYSRRGQGR